MSMFHHCDSVTHLSGETEQQSPTLNTSVRCVCQDDGHHVCYWV